MTRNENRTNKLVQTNVQSQVSKRSEINDPIRSNLIYINARSLIANFNDIELLCTNLKPKLFACSEARITNDIDECEYDIPGYKVITCHSVSRHTGGVAIYIQSNIKFKIISNESWENHIWFVSLEIWNGIANGLYHVFYRSPDKKFKQREVIKTMNKFFDKTLQLNRFNLVMGDLNIDMNKTDTMQNKMNGLLTKYGLSLINNFNTRICDRSQTKIDVVLSNKSNLVNCATLPHEVITDHETVIIEVISEKNSVNNIKEILSWKEYSKYKLIENLRNSSWYFFDGLPLESKVVMLRENLHAATAPSINRVKLKHRINKKAWFTNDLKELKTKKWKHAKEKSRLFL